MTSKITFSKLADLGDEAFGGCDCWERKVFTRGLSCISSGCSMNQWKTGFADSKTGKKSTREEGQPVRSPPT